MAFAGCRGFDLVLRFASSAWSRKGARGVPQQRAFSLVSLALITSITRLRKATALLLSALTIEARKNINTDKMPTVYHLAETKSTYVVRRSVTSGFSFGRSGPSADTGCASFKFLFRDFASLPSEIGEYTESPEFTYKGNKWCIRICPGGDSQERAGCLSLYIKHCDGGEAPSFGGSSSRMNMAFQ